MTDAWATKAELEALRKAAGIPDLPTQLTFEARMAISGNGPRAYDWSDKPHRVVYDLCREIEKNAALPAVQPDAAAIREAALQDAISRVRQSLVDDAHKHGSIVTTRSSAMFTAEIIATNALSRLLSTSTGKEVMPDGTSKVWNHDAAPAGLSAGGGAEKMALCDAIRTGMGVLRVTYVDPDQMREDRDERAKLAREDDQ